MAIMVMNNVKILVRALILWYGGERPMACIAGVLTDERELLIHHSGLVRSKKAMREYKGVLRGG